MYDSPEAAQLKTVSGWISSDGRFFGNDENLARFAGSTHKICECGNEMPVSRIVCDSCYAKVRAEKYWKLPFKEWDRETPLVVYDDDKFFWDEDQIIEYLEENELNPEDLKLVICEPRYPSPIDSSYWEDDLPEDHELPDELQNKIVELNKFIKTLEPLGWWPTDIRTEYKPIPVP